MSLVCERPLIGGGVFFFFFHGPPDVKRTRGMEGLASLRALIHQSGEEDGGVFLDSILFSDS
jgi:hypothetical protein